MLTFRKGIRDALKLCLENIKYDMHIYIYGKKIFVFENG